MQIPKVIHKVIIVDGFDIPNTVPFQTAAIDSFKLPGYTTKIYSGNESILSYDSHSGQDSSLTLT